MKKALPVGLLLWAIVCVLPYSAPAQESLDFTESSPAVVYNGTDYFLNVPELGFMGSSYGIQWRLDQNSGSWALNSVWNIFNRAFVVTTDFATGSFSTFDLSTLAATNNIGAIHSDAAALNANGSIYVINRLGQDNITVYNPADFSTPVRQFSVGNGSNPQALVLLTPSRAYVTLYEKDYILIVNPQTGDELGRIDISAFADGDGIPESGPAVLVNGSVYVLLQVLDRNNFFTPTGGGILLKIDPVTDTVEGSVTLTLQNPGSMLNHPGRKQLLVGAVGTFTNTEDGGIEAINPSTMTSEGVLIRETALGGDLGGFAMADASKGYAIVSDSSFNYQVVSFNLNTGEKMTDIFGPTSAFLQKIAVHKGKLYVLSRDLETPGIIVYNIWDDSRITAEPVDVGLPPFDIVFY
ncbi:MAG: hypothetical protein JRG73_07810 [Deltaproteobacteria bacterium]|nr:hypothetical protein [Deltaproteobacteria bacterium]MBW2306827.1 hypothetical protein [Deltaproteobacteria bacterium]